jgi:hypothetical protein
LGRIVPGVLACFAVAAVVLAGVAAEEQGWPKASATSVFFVALGALCGWLVWKLVRTAWLVVLANDTFTCVATMGSWTFAPGEIVAVRGDVYHQFLHVIDANTKVALWGQFDDREGLLAAIRRANPALSSRPGSRPPDISASVVRTVVFVDYEDCLATAVAAFRVPEEESTSVEIDPLRLAARLKRTLPVPSRRAAHMASRRSLKTRRPSSTLRTRTFARSR